MGRRLRRIKSREITGLDLKAFIVEHRELGLAQGRAERKWLDSQAKTEPGTKIGPNPAINMKIDYCKYLTDNGRSPLEDLLEVAREEMMGLEVVMELKAAINVVGDIHGQFGDLLRVFQLGGYPPQKKYLFLGDYVDRGTHSVETIFFLLALFLRSPERLTLLRGNHELPHINAMYGFLDDCNRRLNVRLYRLFQDVFNCMPLVGRINRKIMCMHGGISRDIHSFNQLTNLARPYPSRAKGIVGDLLWSDPDFDQEGWRKGTRGTGWLFGEAALKDFLAKLNLDMIIRAHQVVQDGYQMFANQRLITVFTAPNYCNEFNNDGAFLEIDKNLKIKVTVLETGWERLRVRNAMSNRSKIFSLNSK